MHIFLQMDDDVEWTDIKRHSLDAIVKFFESGTPITTGAVPDESSEYITAFSLSRAAESKGCLGVPSPSVGV